MLKGEILLSGARVPGDILRGDENSGKCLVIKPDLIDEWR